MPEPIEFVKDWFAEVKADAGRVRQVAFRRGLRLRAEVRPVGAVPGSDEAADLRLEDGTTALRVPLSHFVGGTKRAA